MTTARPERPIARRNRTPLVVAIVVIAAIVIGFFVFAGLYADWLWYKKLGYLEVLTTQWAATAVMFGIGFLAMAIPVWISIEIAFRWRPMYAKLSSQLDRYQQVVEPLRRLATYGIPAVLGVFAGVATSSNWQIALEWLHRTPSGVKDPQFGLDISFYLFELPFYRGVLAFASAVILISAATAFATSYLYGAIRFAGREIRISKSARIQFATLGAIYIAIQGVSIWMDQYATMAGNTSTDLITGPGYTDVNAVIPGRAILAGIAAVVVVLFIITAIIGRWRLPIVGTALLIVSGILIGAVYPWIVQRFQVDPSARSLEAPYIERNIDATRAAYGVSSVSETPYKAKTDTAPGALRNDAETTTNIRILDPALVSDSFAQLEQIKQYYQFAPHLDVDRYTIDGKTQDTVIAVRELNQAGIGNSSNWVNDHIVYTHGYGIVAAYGNQRTVDGMPMFLESGIPTKGDLGDFEPRVYFGEASPDYSIVGAPEGSAPTELDYPSGTEENSQNAQTTYKGDGGPKLDNFLNKLVYAIKFQSEQILLSSDVNEQSQILYDRHPLTRVQKVAPYLTLDTDPYPAVVDGRIVWIVDGYTTSDQYPYSHVEQLSNAIADTYTPTPLFAVDDINYIRNSVKATVDAYTGKVTLYAWDSEDPILKTWQKVFPTTIKPMSEMSPELMEHVRYPSDLFKVQRAVLGTYHVTDPGSWFQSDDAWITPPDPTQPSASARLQPAYYLTMKVPGADKSAFTLYTAYIPQESGDNARSILTGYLAVNADAGSTPGKISPDYGKFTLLTLPKAETVPGPGQVQNNFNADPAVSTELNLLSQGSTDVIKGNLLTLPVGGGLLYVQPVYVRSTGETSYPLLKKVLVAFGDKIAFESTLDGALDKIFGGDSGANAGDNGTPNEPGTNEPGTETPGTEEPGGSTDNAALDAALKDAAQALKDREAAYAANDLVAAAQADQRLQDALERAIAAAGVTP
ncbi:MAG: UPF0182 family protein [Cryobacterium sp.]|nr:UPF0182 family protein [Cryobacterium sp.]